MKTILVGSNYSHFIFIYIELRDLSLFVSFILFILNFIKNYIKNNIQDYSNTEYKVKKYFDKIPIQIYKIYIF